MEKNNKRIIKNTGFLYFRMLLLLFISFYTSRILLEKLGINDFGIYNVVGGIVAMLSSLRSIFATSTQRFLNIAIGEHNEGQVKKIFGTSLYVNGLICVLFFIVAEILGVCFLKYKLNIPEARIFAANIVFQFSVATSLITIFNISFDAVIIAYEQMRFYSYISIIEAIMKLGILYLLSYASVDRLILYSALLFIVAIANSTGYIIYCTKVIGVKIQRISIDRNLLQKMLTFSGWNFFGNFMYSLVNEGINFLLNIFGGVVLNAARAIAYQVRNAVMMFLSNMQIAVQPQLVQSYGQSDYTRFHQLLFLSSRVLFALFILFAMPTFFYTNEILSLWLTVLPNDASVFIKALLIYMMVRSLHGPIDIFFKAYGELKTYQLIETVMFSLPLIFTYILFKINFPAYTAFVVMGIVELFNLLLILFLARKYNRVIFKGYEQVVLGRGFMLLLISFFVNYFIRMLPISLIFHLICSFILTASIIFIIAFNGKEKRYLYYAIIRKS
ncbi:uncharacterized protein BN736_00102 [Prevotella sp. CAG:617]|nr:uncharacterized protein BN736_00102 [Prevotella sp. CAG:617]